MRPVSKEISWTLLGSSSVNLFLGQGITRVSTNQLTSISMLDRLQGPDKNLAWETLVLIYRPFIARTLERVGIASSDIEDLLQDSFASLYVELPRFQHNGNIGAFRNWLRTLVVRRAQRFLQRRKKAPQMGIELAQLPEQFGNSFEELWDREHDEHVVNQLLELIRPEFTTSTWTAFEMHVVQDRRAAEVATVLGCSSNAVLICKSRVLRRLRVVGRGLVEC